MFKSFSIIAVFILLAACNGKVERNYKDYHPQTSEERRDSRMSSIITKSDEPIVIYGGKKSSSEIGGTGIANSYLWKAALESIAFMPLSSSDSNGGTILTDWYSAPETPNEKFKFNIIILGPELQINSIRVTAFKQVLTASGQWRSVEASKSLARDIEDNILKKAITLKARAAK